MSEYYPPIDTQATQQQSMIIGSCIEYIPRIADSDAGVAEFGEIPSALTKLFPNVYLVGQDLEEYTFRYIDVYGSKEDADERFTEIAEKIDPEDIFFVFTGEETLGAESSYSVFWDTYEEDEITQDMPLRQIADLQVRQTLALAEANIELYRSVRFSVWESKSGEFIINREFDDPDRVGTTDEASAKIQERETEQFITRLMKSTIEKLQLTANGEEVDTTQESSTPLYAAVGVESLLDDVFTDLSVKRYADYDDEFSDEAIAETTQEHLDMLADRRNGIGLVSQLEASAIIEILARIINNTNRV